MSRMHVNQKPAKRTNATNNKKIPIMKHACMHASYYWINVKYWDEFGFCNPQKVEKNRAGPLQMCHACNH